MPGAVAASAAVTAGRPPAARSAVIRVTTTGTSLTPATDTPNTGSSEVCASSTRPTPPAGIDTSP